MAAERIFVGRDAELEQFKKVLQDPRGQAILVVGQAGMEKSWLINRMADLAQSHPTLKCGCVRYEVTPTDSVDSTMALMMDNAFEVAQLEEGSFVGTKRRLEQWRSLLNVINLGDLVMSLRRDPQRNTRDQFLQRLALIADKMPQYGRVIFIIDPEKYMQKESDQAWAIVVKQLPEKIKFVFAQRPEDVLVGSDTFGAVNNNVERIPQERLDILDQQAIEQLLNLRAGRTDYTVTELRQALAPYEGHPYAIGAALDLLEAGTKLEDLPPDPTGIAAAQWKELSRRGKDAIRLFKAYAILEVGVPDEVAETVSQVHADTHLSLLAESYLAGLLREEGYGKRIYHAILADHILEHIGETEKKAYHGRAADFYRGKLKQAREKQIAPDPLAGTRLPEHSFAAEGSKPFVDTCVNECGKALLDLGLLDAAECLFLRVLKVVEDDSAEEAMVLGNLGLIYRRRGNFNRAEDCYSKALRLSEQFGLHRGISTSCGNLGVIYLERGDLANAETMHTKALEADREIGNLEGDGRHLANLGVIYMRAGQLDKAEQMFRHAFKLHEKLGGLEGMAACYANLGLICQMKGQLEEAAQMHQKSLEISERLGLQEDLARTYCNLGAVWNKRDDLETARQYWEKAVELYTKIGMPHMVEKVQGWIDELEETPNSEDRSQKAEGGSEQ